METHRCFTQTEIDAIKIVASLRRSGINGNGREDIVGGQRDVLSLLFGEVELMETGLALVIAGIRGSLLFGEVELMETH